EHRNSCVIHQDVDSIEFIDCAFHQSENVLVFGYIATVYENFVARKTPSSLFKRIPSPPVENECRTSFEKPLGRRRTNSRTCSGDNDDLSFKPIHYPYSSTLWRRHSVGAKIDG